MNQNQSFYSVIKQSQIVCAALIIGQIFFLAIAYFITNQNGGGFGDKSIAEVLYFIVAALVIGGVLGSVIVFRNKLTSIKEIVDIQQKITQYRATQIVRWALLEVPSFFAIIAYILTGETMFASVSVAIIILFSLTFPSKARIEKDLELTLEE